MSLPKVARIYYKGEQKPAILIRKARKKTIAAIQTTRGIKTIKLKHKEAEEAPDVLYKGEVYPVDRAIEHFKQSMSRGATNKEVRALLKVGEYGSETRG